MKTLGENVDWKQAEEIIKQEFKMRELIQEDWRDFVASFYFPNVSKCITDPEIKRFIQNTNAELLAEGQEPHVIKLLVLKGKMFLSKNFEVIRNLLEDLKAEQMFEAVILIAQDLLKLGEEKDDQRMRAFANLFLGELITAEHLDNEE